MGASKKVLNQAIAEALGAKGADALAMLGGDEEKAGRVLICIAENPSLNAQQIAKRIRDAERREEGGHVFSGYCDGKRRAPVAFDIAYESDGEEGFGAVGIDFDDPLSSLIALEMQAQIEAHPLAKSLEDALTELEKAQEQTQEEISLECGLKRRRAFEIKETRVRKARARVDFIRSQILRDLELKRGEEEEKAGQGGETAAFTPDLDLQPGYQFDLFMGVSA
jgi:hypothetical protein